MSSIFRLTVQQLSGRWRLLIMTVLGAMPVAFTALVVRSSETPFVAEFETLVLSTMLAGSIGPLIVLAIAAVALGNEVDDRTLANLTLSPLPRWQIVVPKLTATVAVSAPFLLVSAALTSWLAFNHDVAATVSVSAATLVGLLMYAALFVWLGLASKQAIGVGLAYIVLWEGFFSGYVSGVRFLSVRHYAIALMHGLDPRRFADDPHVALSAALVVAAAVVTGFTLLTVRRLRRMDVP
jgi:ABC-2 type transport system permease protein